MNEGRTSTNGQKNNKANENHKSLHPRDGIDRLHVIRKEGGGGLTSIENSVDASMRGLKDNIKCVKKD